MLSRYLPAVLLAALTASAADAQSEAIPPDIVAAWKLAEATPGFVAWQPNTFMTFLPKVEKNFDAPMVLPAFRFRRFESDGLVGLPPPTCPFALLLPDTNLSPADIKALVQMKNLQMLDLSGCKINDDAMADIARLTNLHVLNLSKNFVTDESMASLTKFKHLKALDLTRTNVSDTGLHEMIGMKSLQTLVIGSRLITDLGMEEIAHLSQLRELRLGGAAIGENGLHELMKLRNLSRLQLGPSIDNDALKTLAKLRQLDELDLQAAHVSDAGIKTLVGMRLRVLLLPKDAKTDLGLKYYLAIVPPPFKLDLTGWAITNAALKDISKLHDLRELNISHQKVTDFGVKEIAGLTLLRRLDLSENRITDAGLHELISLRQLRHLNLTHTRITERGVKEFRQALPDVFILR